MTEKALITIEKRPKHDTIRPRSDQGVENIVEVKKIKPVVPDIQLVPQTINQSGSFY